MRAEGTVEQGFEAVRDAFAEGRPTTKAARSYACIGTAG